MYFLYSTLPGTVQYGVHKNNKKAASSGGGGGDRVWQKKVRTRTYGY